MTNKVEVVAADALHLLQVGAADAVKWLEGASSEFAKAAPQVQSAVLTAAGLVMKALTDTQAAASGGGLNIAADQQVFADLKAVATQFKSDLTAIGIKL